MTIANVSDIAPTRIPVFGGNALQIFEAKLSGQLIRPIDSEYDAVRQIWNGRIQKYPALIVRCQTTQDVVLAVNFARQYDLAVSVRAGGHNSNGFAVEDNGLMIDLSLMKRVTVDPIQRVAYAQPGLTFGEFVRATESYGLITTTGVCSGTGIAGATLGGGIGWFMGRYGLAIDNVLSYEIVTAEGQVLKVSAEENADLFWGLRGGGGNFGIVTQFEYRLYPVDQVLAGMIIYPRQQMRDVLRFYRDFNETTPDELIVYATLATVPEIGPAVIVTAAYVGDDLAEGERCLAPLRQFGTPIVDTIHPQKYSELLSAFDVVAPDGRNYYEPAYSANRLNDEAIDTLLTWFDQKTSPFSAILIQRVAGAATRVPAEATAFAMREPHYLLIHDAAWDEGPAGQHIDWAQTSVAAMKSHANPGLYVNYIHGTDEAVVRSSYQNNFERLIALKTKYDPTNFFRANQNIKPRGKAV